MSGFRVTRTWSSVEPRPFLWFTSKHSLLAATQSFFRDNAQATLPSHDPSRCAMWTPACLGTPCLSHDRRLSRNPHVDLIHIASLPYRSSPSAPQIRERDLRSCRNHSRRCGGPHRIFRSDGEDSKCCDLPTTHPARYPRERLVNRYAPRSPCCSFPAPHPSHTFQPPRLCIPKLSA